MSLETIINNHGQHIILPLHIHTQAVEVNIILFNISPPALL